MKDAYAVRLDANKDIDARYLKFASGVTLHSIVAGSFHLLR